MATRAAVGRSASSASSVGSLERSVSAVVHDAAAGSVAGTSASVVVAVRVRPPNGKEMAAGQAPDLVRVADEHVVTFDPPDAFGRDVHYQPGVPTHRNRKARVRRRTAALPRCTASLSDATHHGRAGPHVGPDVCV
jgi:hypothetical protein